MSEGGNENKWKLLQLKLQERKVSKVFGMFNESGFRPILIKGYAAARFYPEGIGRASVDIDLCFDPIEYESAELFRTRNPIDGVVLDLHEGFRNHDSVPWNQLFEASEIVIVEDVPVRLLSPEDHLRVLCVHWLTDGGENKERLWDIYYAVQNREENFDWSRCLDVVGENRRNWVIYTIGLAHHFLDLDISDLPFSEKAKKLPKWLVDQVTTQWDKGVAMVPLSSVQHDRDALWAQIKKRFPPNPIYATVSSEGSFDAKTRIHYQIQNFFMRLGLGRQAVIATIKKILTSRK